MKISHWVVSMTLLALSAGGDAQTVHSRAARNAPDAQFMTVSGLRNTSRDEEQLEKSREAGLLTDWHLAGHYGHGMVDMARRFAPEKEMLRGRSRGFERSQYELVFPEGIFVLPDEALRLGGVFYAKSNTYLIGGGEWNLYLESKAEAIVFVDDRRVLTGVQNATGVQRGTIHVESGYHSVMVKFVAKAAPFRVAILPPNSGSRRKNNTPYLKASPAQEDTLAELILR